MEKNFEQRYGELIHSLLQRGYLREGRNGATTGAFGLGIAIDSVMPILTGRKIHCKGIIGELATMLTGSNKLEDFKKNGCNYWDAWAKPDGTIDLDYGTAWRNFNGVDQLAELIDGLKTNPYGRRHIITGWRPDRLKEVALPCCHILYQWYVNGQNELEMLWYQRSVDVMVGLPSDAIFAYLFNRLVAQTVGLEAGKIQMVLGDTHIYANHIVNALEYLKQPIHKVKYNDFYLDPEATVFNFNPTHFKVNRYEHGPSLKFDLNV